MTPIASLSLQVLCQLISSGAPYFNDTDIAVSNLPPIVYQSPPAVRPTILPHGYIAHPEIGAAYKIVWDRVTWTQARERCNAEGAYLATIDSTKKIDLLKDYLRTSNHTTDWMYVHTGIYRMAGTYVSVSTGTTVSSLPWKSDFPKGNDCVATDIWLLDDYGGLVDRTCEATNFYICEIPIPKNCKTQENQSASISVD